MSWQTEMIRQVRHYINDLEDPPTYTDQRLEELIVVCAMKVVHEVSFNQTYTIDLEEVDIIPDPADLDTRDENFMVLVGYKAAAILSLSEMKTGSKAVAFKDGNVWVDFKNVVLQKKQIADFYEKAYEDARYLYQLAERPSGRGIFGPVSIYGSYYGGYYNNFLFRERPSFS